MRASGRSAAAETRRITVRSSSAARSRTRRADLRTCGSRWEAARAFARHGLGTAVLPAALADQTDCELVCRPVLPDYRLTDRVVWPTAADPLTAAFVDCLTAAFA